MVMMVRVYCFTHPRAILLRMIMVMMIRVYCFTHQGHTAEGDDGKGVLFYSPGPYC